VVAVAASDEAAILAEARATKFRTRSNDPKTLVRYAKLMWNGDLKEMAALSKEDPVEQVRQKLAERIGKRKGFTRA
jgi:hypothetical protein